MSDIFLGVLKAMCIRRPSHIPRAMCLLRNYLRMHQAPALANTEAQEKQKVKVNVGLYTAWDAN